MRFALGSVIVAVTLGAAAVLAARAGAGTYARWQPGMRHVRIEDRTGDQRWQWAEALAVSEWRSARADIDIEWTRRPSFAGGCRYDGEVVSLCRSDQVPPTSGGTQFYLLHHGDLVGSFIWLTPRQDLTQRSMDILACHEIGHAVGMAHNPSPDSCMYPYSGGATVPDGADLASLRGDYARAG